MDDAPSGDAAAALERAIRNVPDFPEPGIQFKDITPLLARPDLLRQVADVLARPFAQVGVTKVVGIEARGFILGPLVARELNAGFVPARKEGKLPGDTIRERYDLEYGDDVIELHADALTAKDCVLVHDDVMATGGTAAAACALVQQTDAELAGISLLIEIAALSGRERLPSGATVQAALAL